MEHIETLSHNIFPTHNHRHSTTSTQPSMIDLDKQYLMTNEQVTGLAQWVIQIQRRYCPTTSYSSSHRSSRCIIDATASIGSTLIAFAQTAAFDRLIAIECDNECFNYLQHNVRMYGLDQLMHYVNESNLKQWFTTQYPTVSPLALMYIDVSIMKLRIPSVNIRELCEYMLFRKNETIDPYLLLLQQQYHHSAYLKCPMVILKIDKEDQMLISMLKNMPVEYVMELNNDCNNYVVLALIGCQATAKEKNLQLRMMQRPQHSMYIPIVQDLNQMRFVWYHNSDLKQRFLQILTSKLFGNYDLQQKVICKLREMLESQEEVYSDQQLYDHLHEVIHNDQTFATDHSNLIWRSKNRVEHIINLLPQGFQPRSYLDVGCAEGSITASVGAALGLDFYHTYGCDVRQISAAHGFIFSLIQPDCPLPYPNGSLSVVTALMCLHHIERPEITLREIFRILEPGGVLIIREHDCNPRELAMVLDIMHGLYGLTLSDPPEDPAFCQTYFAQYRTCQEWTHMITTEGFVDITPEEAYECLIDPKRQSRKSGKSGKNGKKKEKGARIANPFRHYYAIYQKPYPTITIPTVMTESDILKLYGIEI